MMRRTLLSHDDSRKPALAMAICETQQFSPLLVIGGPASICDSNRMVLDRLRLARPQFPGDIDQQNNDEDT